MTCLSKHDTVLMSLVLPLAPSSTITYVYWQLDAPHNSTVGQMKCKPTNISISAVFSITSKRVVCPQQVQCEHYAYC